MRSPSRRPAATSAPTADPELDPRAVPGSYEKQADGSFVRLDEATEHGVLDGPELPAKSAAAIASALTEAGHDVPPHIQAALPAEDPAPAAEEPLSPPAPEPAAETEPKE